MMVYSKLNALYLMLINSIVINVSKIAAVK